MRKRIYIIGNGFDQHHKLNTSFKNYKIYLQSIDDDMVEQIDDFLIKWGVSPNDIDEWSELEKYLSYMNKFDVDELYEYTFENSEQDIERASYWSDPQYIANYKCKELQDIYKFIKNNFSGWIKSLNINDIFPDLSLDLNALYLNFNYTEILEKIYNIPKEQILHIHGSIIENLFILGHNDALEFPYAKEQWAHIDPITNEVYDSQDLREYQVEQEINDAYEEIHKTYFKNSRKLILNNDKFFNEFNDAFEIQFRGFSFGEQDEIYVSEIAKRIPSSCKVILFGYSDKDINKLYEGRKTYFTNNIVEIYKW